MAFVGILSLLKWLYLTISVPSQVALVKAHLLVNGTISDSRIDQAMLKMFVSEGLRPDGVLLLRLIAHNAGDIITTDLIVNMFTEFKSSLKAKQYASIDQPVQYPNEKSGIPDDEKQITRRNILPPYATSMMS